MAISFEVVKRDGKARKGRLATPHGAVETPAFMPVGTRASVKGLHPPLLKEAGARIVLSNTFHLALRPGSKRIGELGGLHRFMGWDGPILTDSGGYQVFSLAKLRDVSEDGVTFSSPVDGQKLFLSPEKAVEIQEELGVDIAMALDELVPAGSPLDAVRAAALRTTRWAQRCANAKRRDETSLFGIVQGGFSEELRERSAGGLASLGLPGYAAGGFSVGESKDDFRRMASFTAPLMPEEKPRYLMGVGTPLDLVDAASWGYDLFDCVLPTRNGRNGQLFTWSGVVVIKNAANAADDSPLDPACGCWGCRNVSRAYLHHLYRAKDPTAVLLNSLHNLTFYFSLMAKIRDAIAGGNMKALREQVALAYQKERGPEGPLAD